MTRRHLVLRAALALALGAASVGGGLGPQRPAAASEDYPGVSASLASDFAATASPEMSYGVLVTANSMLASVTGVTWTLGVTTTPLEDGAALDEFMQDPDGARTRVVAQAPSAAAPGDLPGNLPAGATTTTALTTAPGGLGLPADAPGVYGIVVSLRVDGEVVWSKAAPLTWRASAFPDLTVAVAVPVTGSPERVASLLMAASDTRATLVVDPTALNPTQLRDAERRGSFALPTGNVDLTSIAHAAVPTLADLAVGHSTAASSMPWLAVAAVADQDTARLATDRGAVALLTSAKWSPAPIVDTPPAGVGTVDLTGAAVPVVVADAGLSAALAGSTPGDSANSALVVAHAALAAAAGKGTVVAFAGDSWVVDGTRPSRALDALWKAPFVSTVSLADVIASADAGTAALPETRPSGTDIPATIVSDVASALARLAVLEDAATQRSAMIDAARTGLLDAVSTGERADIDRRASDAEAALATAREVLGAVAVTSGSELTLVSSSGDVPLTVTNGLDVPVSVRVDVTSRSPALVTKSQPVVTIEPGTTTTITVPVEAVSSGDVAVTVALRTTDGLTVTLAETLRVRVRAAWGTAVTGVITAGLAVLFVAGVVRTIARGRKDTRLVPTADTLVAGEPQGDQ